MIYGDMESNKEIELLLDIVEEAIDLVEEPYFNLKTTYEPEGIVRESVEMRKKVINVFNEE